MLLIRTSCVLLRKIGNFEERANKWRERMNCVDKIKKELKYIDEFKESDDPLSKNKNDEN